jgi:exodeoxyribonuclease V gamma subunit
MDLLSISGVHRQFGISADDLPTIAGWIADVGIRWGIDAEHRAEHDQPPYEENTWRFGLDRLLLGAAMRGDGLRVFADVLPFDDIEGSSAELAGRFAEFCQTLFDFKERLQDARALNEWRDELSALLEQLVNNDDDVAWSHEQIRRILTEAADEAESVGYDSKLPLVAMRNLMRAALTEGRSAYGFLTGSVTFCEMLPMRAIPFRVVCMLGMDERSFPRAGTRLGFDLVAQDPKVGDRSSRDDDRYLFLEALLSARDRLLITYTGQSVKDNSPLPPSVVISELLDTCVESFEVRKEKVTAESFVTRHGLQPFSEVYFRSDHPQHFTYAHEFHSGAESLREPRTERSPFLSQRSEPSEVPDTIAVHELVRFFRDPVRYFFNTRLGVYLNEKNVALLEREPIVLDRLQSSILAGRLLDRAAGGQDLEESFSATRGEGALPLGEPGGTKYDSLVASVGPLERALNEVRVVEEPEFRAVELEIDGTTIVGRIRGLFGGRLVKHQYSRVRGDHEIDVWIRHLILCATGSHRESVLIGRPSRHSAGSRYGSAGLDVEVTRYRAVPDAEVHLAALLNLWKEGMREPLLLFPVLGLIWQENVNSRKDRWREVHRSWGGSGPIPGQKEKPYAKVLLDGTPPFELDRVGASYDVLGALPSKPELTFSALAQTVFAPMLEYRER